MNPSLILSCSNPPYCNLSYFILMCIILPPRFPVLSREEFIHLAGLLRSPQRLPAVWIGRLDSGENRPSGAAREPRAETRGPRQPGRGAPKTAHTQTL